MKQLIIVCTLLLVFASCNKQENYLYEEWKVSYIEYIDINDQVVITVYPTDDQFMEIHKSGTITGSDNYLFYKGDFTRSSNDLLALNYSLVVVSNTEDELTLRHPIELSGSRVLVHYTTY